MGIDGNWWALLLVFLICVYRLTTSPTYDVFTKKLTECNLPIGAKYLHNEFGGPPRARGTYETQIHLKYEGDFFF